MRNNSFDIIDNLLKLFDAFIGEIKKGDPSKNIDAYEGGPENFLFSKILNEVDKVIEAESFEYGSTLMIFNHSSFEEKGIPREELLQFIINEKGIIQSLNPTSEEIKKYRELLLKRLHLMIDSNEG